MCVSLTDRILKIKMVNILCFEENSAYILEAEDNASDHSNYCLYMLFTSSEIEEKKTVSNFKEIGKNSVSLFHMYNT